LDVGCGTGRIAAALVEQYGCKVWGVDASSEMLAVARERLPPEVGLKFGTAEDLPFRDAWFAFPEIRRVLGDGGRYAFITFDPSYFAGYYLIRYFPSFHEIDLGRFASASRLEEELQEAGFAAVRIVPHRRERTIDRDAALKRIRGRHISTFQLISEEEYAEGLARAERELPERITYEYHWLIVVT
jgi:SAM-dependent methyltransferase